MEHAIANAKQSEHAKGASTHMRQAAQSQNELHPVLEVQQQVGNQAMQQLLRAGFIHAKLTVSQPEDPEEREADAVSDRIMRSHAGPAAAASTCSCSNEEEMCDECRQRHTAAIMRKEAGPGLPSVSHGVLNRMRQSAGHPLDISTRSLFESRLGRDFGGVRVHTDSSAESSASALRANAYALGSDIFFAAGKYAPGTKEGRRLLAHEITHTVQHSHSGGQTAESILSRQHVAVGRTRDPLEAEADRVADSVMRLQDAAPLSISADRANAVRGNWLGDAWDSVKDAGEWVGDKAVSAGEWVGDKAVAAGEWVVDKAEDAGEWVTDKAVAAGKWVGNKLKGAGEWAWGKLQNAWGCLKATGHAVSNIVTGDVHSLTDLLGIPAPEGADPSTLDTVIAVLKHPCLQMIPGYGLLSGAVGVLEKAGKFLVGAYHLLQNPQPVIDGIQKELGKLIAAIPAYVEGLVKKALQAVGSKAKEHGEGVWRHLEPKLAYLAKNWWDVVKQTGWNILWPWPAVGKDLGECWDHLKSAGKNLWHLNFSKALDDILAIGRSVNNILGSLYGWFFIASVLIGTIIGAFFGGAGAVPGFWAGVGFAGEVGEALVGITVGIESASILKAVYNLLAQNETQNEKEQDYEQVASSGLTLAITGVMVILGEIAVKFAQGLLSRVAGLFRRLGTADVDAAATGLSKTVKGETPAVDTATDVPKVKGADAAPDQTSAAAADIDTIRTQELPKLEEEIHSPENVHPPHDAKLAAEFDAEVEVGEHTYRRSNSDGTWCRFSEPLCGIQIPEVKAEVDAAVEAKPSPKAKLSDEAIDLAIERLMERHNIDPARIDELRQFLREHPERLEDIGELMRDTPDLFDKEEVATGTEQQRGGSKPGEIGKVGKDMSRAASRDVFNEKWIVDEAKFTVTTDNGAQVNLIADMGTIGPGAEPRLVEAKLGSGAGLEPGQEIGYPILSTKGGVPANRAAEDFARAAFPDWKPGQPIPPVRVRIDWWSGIKRTSIWLP